MKVHSTDYTDTFIVVAEDCAAVAGELPPDKGDVPTVASLQFKMLEKKPYVHTSDDVLFAVHALRKDIGKNDLKAERSAFFSKGQACFRASPLTKRYGWGVHSNADGKIAIYAVGSEKYKALVNDKSIKKVKAMRSAR